MSNCRPLLFLESEPTVDKTRLGLIDGRVVQKVLKARKIRWWENVVFHFTAQTASRSVREGSHTESRNRAGAHDVPCLLFPSRISSLVRSVQQEAQHGGQTRRNRYQIHKGSEIRTLNLSFLCLIFLLLLLFAIRQSEQLEAVRQADHPEAQNASSDGQTHQAGAEADHNLCTNNAW